MIQRPGLDEFDLIKWNEISSDFPQSVSIRIEIFSSSYFAFGVFHIFPRVELYDSTEPSPN